MSALLLGIKTAASVAGIGRDAMYELVRVGTVRSVAIGRRRLIPRSELDAWIAREMGGETSVQTGSGMESGPRPSPDRGPDRVHRGLE